METNEKKVSHTPGPWKFSDQFNSNWSKRIRFDVKTGSKYIASIIVEGYEVEDEANAKLIAAAPELLAALEMCLPVVSEFSSKAYFAAKEAIKKATE